MAPLRSSRIVNAKRVRRSLLLPPFPTPRIKQKSNTELVTGKPVSHQFAKELLVGIAGAEIDKLAETKGMDWVDREKAKHHAEKNVQHMYDEHYVRGQNADQYDP